jgi:hypothetical protein
MLVDPGFIAETQKANIEINQPRSGADVASLIEDLHRLSPDLIKKASAAISP